MLQIKNLTVRAKNQLILNNCSLNVDSGSIAALMGPNGSGKSTLAKVIMGHPAFTVVSGEIIFNGQNLLEMPVDERALAGIFLAFQFPPVLNGVHIKTLLQESYRAVHGQIIDIVTFDAKICEYWKLLNIDESFLNGYVNKNMSGGECKKLEVLQFLLLQPKLAIFDEIDSGLDVDALQAIAKAIMIAKKENSNMTVMLITHYQRILQHVVPDVVHILQIGTIMTSGDSALAKKIDQVGYVNVHNKK
jgi:Fe-S cluster assembly ATP-binding protein